MTITGNLGAATAYGYAKRGGYTGTEEEFQALMAGYADAAQYSQAAAASADESADSAELAESWAVGGTSSRSGEDTNNASYFATQAASSATAAAGSASDADDSAEAAATSATAAATSATAAAAFVGAPLLATSASDMTDTTRIYVYMSPIPEAGYSNGHWYSYMEANDSWVDGGTYQTMAGINVTQIDGSSDFMLELSYSGEEEES